MKLNARLLNCTWENSLSYRSNERMYAYERYKACMNLSVGGNRSTGRWEIGVLDYPNRVLHSRWDQRRRKR